jgi:hypothetical protein
LSISLCTADDVLARPELAGVALSATQTAQLPGYIDEASTLVCGYLGHAYTGTSDDPVPNAARIVAARVVARALTSPRLDPNFDTYNSSMGPLAHTKHVAPDAIGGGVWLTRQDKLMLDSISTLPRFSNVALHAWPACQPITAAWLASVGA